MAPTSTTPVASPSTRESSPADVRRLLWRVYSEALPRYVLPAGIAARSMKQTGSGWELTEPCPLNTADVLKAAYALENVGVAPGLDTRALMDAVMRDYIPAGDYQVVALTLWAAAFGRATQARELANLLEARIPSDLSQSMSLGWVLAAVCAYAEAFDTRPTARSFAATLYGRLLANQNAKTSLFHASARREGLLRRRVADATLSSQTYPVYALSQFARVFGASDALVAAERCADRLCALQGSQGQWWWRYDVAQGSVGSAYPVYAVNQDGAIPLAFGALQRELGDRRYDAAVNRGLLWESGANELSASLIDGEQNVVARCVESDSGGFRLTWEMYAYQPSRSLLAMMSEPAWLAEARA